MSEDFGSLKGGGDCQDHYHNSDRYPTRDSLKWLQSLENVKTITTNYVVSLNDDIIIINGAGLTVTLPASQNGRHCAFTVNSGSATITPYGTETINGAATLVVDTTNDAAYLKAVSGGWVNLVPDANHSNTASDVTNTPAGNISATNVQAALNELDTEKALKAGSASQSFSMLNGTVAGTLSLTGTASTLGYGTGAGGTVTQATSKSNTVTLNKPCGQITMNNEALNAGAAIAFDLTNSLITSGDVVVVNSQNFGNYSTQVQTLLSGGARIRLTNLTAGTLSDAVVINFAIIKGATS